MGGQNVSQIWLLSLRLWYFVFQRISVMLKVFIFPVFRFSVVLNCGIFFLVFSALNQSTILTSQSADSENSKAPEPPKLKRNRCFMCRKKVGLTGKRETYNDFGCC